MTEPRCGFTSTTPFAAAEGSTCTCQLSLLEPSRQLCSASGMARAPAHKHFGLTAAGPPVSRRREGIWPAEWPQNVPSIGVPPQFVFTHLGTTCAAVCWKFGPPKLILRATDYIVPHQYRFNRNASSIPSIRPPFITRQQNSMWPKRQRALRR
jgi:hypothetical protein